MKLHLIHSTRINPNKLLEEHYTYTDMGSSPASTSRAIRPRCELQFDPAYRTSVVEVQVSKSVTLLMKGDFSSNINTIQEYTHRSVVGSRRSLLRASSASSSRPFEVNHLDEKGRNNILAPSTKPGIRCSRNDSRQAHSPAMYRVP